MWIAEFSTRKEQIIEIPRASRHRYVKCNRFRTAKRDRTFQNWSLTGLSTAFLPLLNLERS